jgi:ParB family chromosome partitioning protein
MKKGELVESADKYLSGSRWLPENLKVKPSAEI